MSQVVRVVVVDDEPLARESLRLLLEKDAGIALVGEAGNGRDAITLITRLKPDLVFLDIQMPEFTGLEVIGRLPEDVTPAVVFVTAYDQYAVEAFRAEALDYLLKPFDDERFHETLRRARERLKDREWSVLGRRVAQMLHHGEQMPATEPLQRLVIRSGGRMVFVRVADIDWIEAADNYVSLHVGKKVHLLRETIHEMESRLDNARFVRIHRSTIVNTERIQEIRPQHNGDCSVILRDGTSLRLSRSRREHVEHLLVYGSN